jgi:hypothetical protein
MFYSSTTTISSIDEAELRTVDQLEPMPFFKVDPRMPTMQGTLGSDDVRSSTSNPSRAVSTASSGVLGPVTIDVDPDTDNEEDDDDESIDSSASEFEHLVRNVSLVRRGTATIIRNASSRRSVVPEVQTSFSEHSDFADHAETDFHAARYATSTATSDSTQQKDITTGRILGTSGPKSISTGSRALESSIKHV